MENMKYFILISILGLPFVSQAQINNDYCYYNKNTKYAEILHFENDTVIIIGQMNKTCDEINIERGILWAKENGYLWEMFLNKDTLQFTKTVDAQQNGLVIEYNYHGTVTSEGLNVEISYSPDTYYDSLGPSQRLYSLMKNTPSK